MSPSGDRRQTPAPENSESEENAPVPSLVQQETGKDTTKSRAGKIADDDELELDDEVSENDETEIPEGSLFDYNIPGVLSKEQMSKLDLAHWKLLVRTSLIELEDLRGWERWKVDDPGSIKGIAAELIAAAGPKLLQNSALVIF